MQSITSTTALKEAILQLENRRKNQREMLNERLLTARESLMPANLIKNILGNVLKSPKLISGILLAAAGLTTTFFLKKKLSQAKPTKSRNIFGIILSTVTKAVFSELF
jgi:hypothetical protein